MNNIVSLHPEPPPIAIPDPTRVIRFATMTWLSNRTGFVFFPSELTPALAAAVRDVGAGILTQADVALSLAVDGDGEGVVIWHGVGSPGQTIYVELGEVAGVVEGLGG